MELAEFERSHKTSIGDTMGNGVLEYYHQFRSVQDGIDQLDLRLPNRASYNGQLRECAYG